MSTAYTVDTVLAAAFVAFSAVSVFAGAPWVVQSIADYGVPRSWLPWLGTAKAAGAVGLVVGLFVPVVAVLAGVGLVLYFLGAVVTVLRAHWYSHVQFPLMFLAPVVGSLVLKFAR
ncbi:MAG TPA: DoxX family protein [Pseudonocardiaceae bacterium]|nr:DoxX family protein [Pseudonocardiaceae bacterium]